MDEGGFCASIKRRVLLTSAIEALFKHSIKKKNLFQKLNIAIFNALILHIFIKIL
jgi:hypothetical protein